MKTINRRSTLPFAAMVALLFLSFAVPADAQSAQDQLVGTWMLVSIYDEPRMAASSIRLVPIRQAS